jgi:hypothetical protein
MNRQSHLFCSHSQKKLFCSRPIFLAGKLPYPSLFPDIITCSHSLAAIGSAKIWDESRSTNCLLGRWSTPHRTLTSWDASVALWGWLLPNPHQFARVDSRRLVIFLPSPSRGDLGAANRVLLKVLVVEFIIFSK